MSVALSRFQESLRPGDAVRIRDELFGHYVGPIASPWKGKRRLRARLKYRDAKERTRIRTVNVKHLRSA